MWKLTYRSLRENLRETEYATVVKHSYRIDRNDSTALLRVLLEIPLVGDDTGDTQSEDNAVVGNAGKELLEAEAKDSLFWSTHPFPAIFSGSDFDQSWAIGFGAQTVINYAIALSLIHIFHMLEEWPSLGCLQQRY